MAKNLVIVESPAKAKTIAGYLGKDYRVESSYGHIRDLPKKELGVDIKAGFKPVYQIDDDKQKTVKSLKAAARGATIWLASDEDREGEAIAWHVCLALGVKPKDAKRIVFHEITKPAILAAVETPRTIDMKLVEAQQARRILDRLVGYELSPVLWRKVRTGLSAGRVQSVAVRLIVEREREIKAFTPAGFFKITAVFDGGGQFPAEALKEIKTRSAAKDFLKAIEPAKFSVGQITQKAGRRSPGGPFTTSSLQQEAARKLGYSVRQTMRLAQQLYESGHITYMRTDSTNLSPIAAKAIESYVVKKFGAKYSKPMTYKTKTRSAQEAHEAIRPTHIDREQAGADDRQKKLYGLIWRRAVASQMAPADTARTEVTIDVSGRPDKFLAVGEVLVFDGFLKVYGGSKDDQLLPKLKEGQSLKLVSLSASEKFSRGPTRFSEAGLVKRLEELGIGRPSTYAPTISTIQDREYVEKKDIEGEPRSLAELSIKKGKITENTLEVAYGAERGKLAPTTLGEVVNDFLVKYFASIVDYDFTAKAEEELDDIAEGKLVWKEMLEKFYKQFHPLVEKSADASRAEATGARELGKDPKSGQPVIARLGRYGPVLQMGASAEAGQKSAADEKPSFAPLPEGASLEDITLEQALPMFKLPRLVGQTADGAEITADIGRYGPYVKTGSTFVSIKGEDPFKIDEKTARKLIADKAKAAAEKQIADFGKIKVLRGPYGPYITDGKQNARVPKEQDPTKLTEAKAAKLLAEAPARKFRRFAKRG